MPVSFQSHEAKYFWINGPINTLDVHCSLCGHLILSVDVCADHYKEKHTNVYIAWDQNSDLLTPFKHTEILEVLEEFYKKDPEMSTLNTEESDPVNHPSHYTFGKYEVLPVLMDWFGKQPLLWQVVKYLSRAKHKGNYLQDLRKAEFYLKKAIEDAEKD